jgi:anti-sigma B factor antagonist
MVQKSEHDRRGNGLRHSTHQRDGHRLTVAGHVEIDRSETGVAIVSLIGEHELYSVLDIERALDEAIREGLAVVIDLSGTEFLDSSVVAILLRAREEAHVEGSSFALVIDDSTGQSVRQLFEITGLATIFRVVSSRAEALTH